MKKNSAVILLSGGLDSYVSLDMAQKKYDIKLAITFDYGQKPFREEFAAAKKIAKHYNIEHKKIVLPFLKEIKGESIWVPNRNGLFLNIAGCFCDALIMMP
jgi:7-cyano-7-deazaguanine synthase